MALWLALDKVPYRLRGSWWLWLVDRYDMRVRVVIEASLGQAPYFELVRPSDGEERNG